MNAPMHRVPAGGGAWRRPTAYRRVRDITRRVFAAILPLMVACAATGPANAADKLFAVTFTTGPAWDAATPAAGQKFYREHSAHLARLRAEGRIVLGGRYGDKGLLLVRAADEAAARAQFAGDPAIGAGTFAFTLEEFRPFYHGDTRGADDSREIAVVRAALAAFNSRDADAVASHYADDITWTSVLADGKTTVDGDSRESIRQWLIGYFKSLPDIRSEITDVAQTGPYVSFRERATWTLQDGTRRVQSSLGVYEVRDGKIQRAWYYPAVREPAAAPPDRPAPTP